MKVITCGLTGFSFMNDVDHSDSEEDEQPQARGRRTANGQARDRVAEKEKARKKMHADIAKAAGGPLIGVV